MPKEIHDELQKLNDCRKKLCKEVRRLERQQLVGKKNVNVAIAKVKVEYI